MVDISAIIVSFNTASITKKCVENLVSAFSQNKKISSEIIVVDNASLDGTISELEKLRIDGLRIIKNKKNIGFGAANNLGLKVAKGKYTLFLNSDVMIDRLDFGEILDYMKNNSPVGALTIRLNLQNKTLDPACHRGFPTPWNAFCYFLKLEHIFGKIPILNILFGGYHLTSKNLSKIHEIDSPSGAFYFGTTETFKKLKGFDEDFFMYGEDLDLSYRLKKSGYKIIYYPNFEALHLKYQSGLQHDSVDTKKKTKIYFYDAMEIFYKKHYSMSYPKLFNNLIYTFIHLMKK